MRFVCVLLTSVIGASLISGCAKPNQQLKSSKLVANYNTVQNVDSIASFEEAALSDKKEVKVLPYKPSSTKTKKKAVELVSVAGTPPRFIDEPGPVGSLRGRTLTVSRASQILLRPKEVILTFDDGPRPGKTEKILSALGKYNAKGVFLMVGSAAKAHPALARRVANAGHSIGSHTFDHANLRTVSTASAMANIRRGERAVAAALGTSKAPQFFRFPYLADTQILRQKLADRGTIVMDVGVDSKDYYKDSPTVVMNRTLRRLEARSRGIILFHDIHARTVAMLPRFLGELKKRGYKVVTLRGTNTVPIRRPDLVASIQ